MISSLYTLYCMFGILVQVPILFYSSADQFKKHPLYFTFVTDISNIDMYQSKSPFLLIQILLMAGLCA